MDKASCFTQFVCGLWLIDQLIKLTALCLFFCGLGWLTGRRINLPVLHILYVYFVLLTDESSVQFYMSHASHWFSWDWWIKCTVSNLSSFLCSLTLFVCELWLTNWLDFCCLKSSVSLFLVVMLSVSCDWQTGWTFAALRVLSPCFS